MRQARGFLETARGRQPILCDVAPGAYPLMGASVADLFQILGRFGYAGVDVERAGRPVRPEALKATTNVLSPAVTIAAVASPLAAGSPPG